MKLIFMPRFVRRILKGVFLGLPNSLCISVEIFVRRGFGARYLTWAKIFKAFFGTVLFIFLAAIFVGHLEAPLFDLWLMSFWLISFWHKGVIIWRNIRHEQWHSQSPGQALFYWRLLKINETLLFRFLEPLQIFVLGLVLLELDVLMAIWLITASSCLFIKRQAHFYAKRNASLALIDSRIKSEELQQSLAPEPTLEKAEIFTVTPVTPAQSKSHTTQDGD